MSNQNVFRAISLGAGADLSTKQYHFGVVNSSGRVVAASAIGQNAVGVIQEPTARVGYAIGVAVQGELRVAAGGTITAGDKIMTDAAGKAVAFAAGAGRHVLGLALTSAVNNGFVTVLMPHSNDIIAA